MTPHALACGELASIGRLLARTSPRMRDDVRDELLQLCEQLQARHDDEAAADAYRVRELQIEAQQEAERRAG